MVVTGIFHLDEEESALQPVRADSDERSECKPDRAQPSTNERSECKPDRAQSSINERSECKPDREQSSIGRIYEEKIAEYETLVSMRARNLRQAMLLSDLLSQAGAQDVVIDAQAA